MCLCTPDAGTTPYSMSGMRSGTDQGRCAHQVGSSAPAQADNFQNGVSIGRLALDLHAQESEASQNRQSLQSPLSQQVSSDAADKESDADLPVL